MKGANVAMGTSDGDILKKLNNLFPDAGVLVYDNEEM